MKMEILKLCSMVYLVYLHSTAEGATFNVGQNGAKADGKTDDAKAFETTWTQACESSGPATILVPKGTYSVGPVKLTGPCKNVPSITIQMDGVLKALTDLSNSKTGDWFYFGNVEGLTITGGGTFDGQGEAVWHTNDCVHNPKCSVLPNNLKFIAANNLVLNGFTSLNSKYFHIGVVECSKVKINNLKVIAPDESPNTDGMHIERSSDVSIHDTKITTGDDCISLGQGLTNVEIAGITCGPGHGISIGSLGKYPNEKDVTGIIIRDSTMSGTMNGIRIKSWANSPSPSKVSMKMCYVGKATKIFIFIIAVLAVVGLVLGFGVFRHGIQKAHKCENGCRPGFPDPIPSNPVLASPPPPGTVSVSPYIPNVPPSPVLAPPPYILISPPNPVSGSGMMSSPPQYSPPSPVSATPGPVQG